MRILITAATALTSMFVLAGGASAANYQAQGFDIVDAAAVVRIIPENRSDISVETTAGSRVAAPQVRVENGRVIVDGNVTIRSCNGDWGGGNNPTVTINGVGAVHRNELPVITIRAPRSLDFSARGAVFSEVGASNGGRMAFHGCGDAQVANVNGDLDVLLRGSGDVDLHAVSGALKARLEGSGDLRGENAASAELSLAGSGDVQIARVSNGLSAALDGSGDLRVNQVGGGAVRMRLAGSGDLSVGGGSASELDADLAGSGDLSFGGRAGVLRARLAGSGDIRVASADRVETLRDSGSGDISVN